MDNDNWANFISEAALNVYLDQGCVFLPPCGKNYNGDFDYGDGKYWSGSEWDEDVAANIYFTQSGINCGDGSDKIECLPVRLVK